MAGRATEIPALDRKGLRNFALLAGGILAPLFGLLYPWMLERPLPLWPWFFGGLVAIWGIVAPTTLRPIYRTWMRFGILMGRLTTPLLMGLVFFVAVTPTGVVRRLFGKDPLRRELNDAETYRLPSKKAPIKNLKRPF